MEKESKTVGLEKEDALNQAREWELERLLLEWGKSGHPRLWAGDKPGSKLGDE